MTSMQSLIDADRKLLPPKYTNPNFNKDLLSGHKLPSGISAVIGTNNIIPDTYYGKYTIGTNDYFNNSKFNNYPSQWRSLLRNVRSLDAYEIAALDSAIGISGVPTYYTTDAMLNITSNLKKNK